ncbi:hypothetical protein OKW41_006961 [Paraburkholderia sp. UCT70]|uniref:hypothetical protein n=1 Tax=Paraburkholderia sp. UCT70 TaxID=2991068 RepID=UPI003D1DBB59
MNTEKKDEGSPYTDDHWENDPFLTSNPERDARVKRDIYPMWKAVGFTLDQIKDPEAKAAYAEYLRQDAAEGKVEDAPHNAG